MATAPPNNFDEFKKSIYLIENSGIYQLYRDANKNPNKEVQIKYNNNTGSKEYIVNWKKDNGTVGNQEITYDNFNIDDINIYFEKKKLKLHKHPDSDGTIYLSTDIKNVKEELNVFKLDSGGHIEKINTEIKLDSGLSPLQFKMNNEDVNILYNDKYYSVVKNVHDETYFIIPLDLISILQKQIIDYQIYKLIGDILLIYKQSKKNNLFIKTVNKNGKIDDFDFTLNINTSNELVFTYGTNVKDVQLIFEDPKYKIKDNSKDNNDEILVLDDLNLIKDKFQDNLNNKFTTIYQKGTEYVLLSIVDGTNIVSKKLSLNDGKIEVNDFKLMVDFEKPTIKLGDIDVQLVFNGTNYTVRDDEKYIILENIPKDTLESPTKSAISKLVTKEKAPDKPCQIYWDNENLLISHVNDNDEIKSLIINKDHKIETFDFKFDVDFKSTQKKIKLGSYDIIITHDRTDYIIKESNKEILKFSKIEAFKFIDNTYIYNNGDDKLYIIKQNDDNTLEAFHINYKISGGGTTNISTNNLKLSVDITKPTPELNFLSEIKTVSLNYDENYNKYKVIDNANINICYINLDNKILKSSSGYDTYYYIDNIDDKNNIVFITYMIPHGERYFHICEIILEKGKDNQLIHNKATREIPFITFDKLKIHNTDNPFLKFNLDKKGKYNGKLIYYKPFGSKDPPYWGHLSYINPPTKIYTNHFTGFPIIFNEKMEILEVEHKNDSLHIIDKKERAIYSYNYSQKKFLNTKSISNGATHTPNGASRRNKGRSNNNSNNNNNGRNKRQTAGPYTETTVSYNQPISNGATVSKLDNTDQTGYYLAVIGAPIALFLGLALVN